MKSYKKIGVFTVFALLFLGISSCDTPNWLPPQYAGMRYYYMPDIETYYDLTNHDFIYLDNGDWLFSTSLPPMYGNYDLYNGYYVALNMNVFQPWMHHQFYISNYPRYYYRNRYQGDAFLNLRGFNENDRKPFYWKQEERNHMNEARKNDRHEDRHEPSRPSQKPNYYGKNIGEPVKVRPQMREKTHNNVPQNKPNDRPKNQRSGGHS
jgi:hypothetical protein